MLEIRGKKLICMPDSSRELFSNTEVDLQLKARILIASTSRSDSFVLFVAE